MAKGKPNLAFLEALRQDKRRRGDQAPGGAFKTPEWFNKSPAAPQQDTKAAAVAGMASAGPAGRKGFRLTYTHMAIGGVAVLVIAGVMFMARQKQPQPKNSVSVETVRSAPPQGNVMDVPAGRAAVMPPALVAVQQQAVANPPAAGPAQQQASAANIAPAATGARTVGMNYVVFQSYKDDKTANEAKDALVAAGIGATVEKGHPYAPTWFVVVGTQGFVKTNAADYLQYINKSKAISEKFAGRNKWKQFEPNAYKWR